MIQNQYIIYDEWFVFIVLGLNNKELYNAD